MELYVLAAITLAAWTCHSLFSSSLFKLGSFLTPMTLTFFNYCSQFKKSYMVSKRRSHQGFVEEPWCSCCTCQSLGIYCNLSASTILLCRVKAMQHCLRQWQWQMILPLEIISGQCRIIVCILACPLWYMWTPMQNVWVEISSWVILSVRTCEVMPSDLLLPVLSTLHHNNITIPLRSPES